MLTLLEQQQIAAQKLSQPLADVINIGFVDPNTNIFCVVSAFNENKKLMNKEQLKNYRGGFTLLVGTDGGVLSGGSAFSYTQLIKKYLKGERNPQ